MSFIINQIDNVNEIDKYMSSDTALMVSKSFGRSFGNPEDYVELHVYSPNNDILYSDYSFKGYSVPTTLQGSSKFSILSFSPAGDLNNLGYGVGSFNVQYNILKNKIQRSANPTFFISEISQDRTEIRVLTNILSDVDIESSTIEFISEIQSSTYYKDFLLNFGKNNLYTAVNISLDKNTSPYSILIKLYQPLPSVVNINDSFWFVEELSNSYSYSVQLNPDPVTGSPIYIGPPNFDIDIDNRSIKSSDYSNYKELLSNSDTSVYHLILNKLQQNNVTLNIDYSNFSNFIHFSSAKQRLLNFKYKVEQIESYNRQISLLNSTFITPSVSSSICLLNNNVSDIIKKFDGYDHYLYFSSESNAWPKNNPIPPYTLFSPTSSIVKNWLGNDDTINGDFSGQLSSASIYDSDNYNNLLYAIPEFIRIDSANKSYETFVEMIGQHFDYIWTYIKAIGDIYKANNSLSKGISKDLVYYILKNFGIKLYNSIDNQDLFQYLTGVTNSGSYVYPTDGVETLVTASQFTTSGKDYVEELFKRIYHNIPYLVKSKGTDNSIRALSSIFGIPSTILRFNEYGGMDKNNSTIQYSYDRYSYSLVTDGSGSVRVPWDQLSINAYTNQPASFANTIEFRFRPFYKNLKVDESGHILIDDNGFLIDVDGFRINLSEESFATQSLLEIGDNVNSPNLKVALEYSSSNNIPYGNIKLYLKGPSGYSVSNNISLPIFYTGSIGETSWWNVMLRRRNPSFSLENDLIDYDIEFVTDNDLSLINVGTFDSSGSNDQYYDIFVKNGINGNIGHQGSSSIYVSGSSSSSFNSSWDTSATVYLGGYSGNTFIGDLQELRFWNYPLNQYRFNYHVLNPSSIEGVNSGSSYNNLAGWFPLGNDLITYNHYLTSSVVSVHPNQQAIFPTASFIGFSDYVNYMPGVETYYANAPIAGYLSPVTDKIRIDRNNITSSILSPYVRTDINNKYFTKDIHIINSAFSPINEIDRDIINSLGSTFNIDNYIGDPGEQISDNYSDLSNLRQLYFQKYLNKYNLKDYIRLIKFFDNALFKMIEDFVAARSDIQTGLSIRPTLLERNKIPRKATQVIDISHYTSSIGNIHVNGSSIYKSGYNDGRDFFNGELSGSRINVDELFNGRNYNPYIYNKGANSLFKGSIFDIYENNVSQNITSSTIKKIDQNGKLLVPIQLQDYYYTYKRHIIPRYLGSKSISKVINFYTSASYSGSTLIWSGDKSYGKTAAVDINPKKFAWIKRIPSSSINFYDKTAVLLKYLINESGSLTELSRHNYNIFDVQNMFKSGDPVVVSLSDLLHPSNQTTLDGNKNIFEGGFSYWPIIYRETAEQLHFRYLTSIISSASISLTATQNNIWKYNTKRNDVGPDAKKNLDDDTADGIYALIYGNQTLSQGTYALQHVFPFSSWSYADESGLKEVGSVTFQSGSGDIFHFPSLPFTTGIVGDADQFVYPINNFYYNLSDQVSTNDSFSHYVKLNDGSYAYKAPRSSIYNINVKIPVNVSINDVGASGGTILKLLAVIERNTGSNAEGNWEYLDSGKFTHVEASTVMNTQYAWNNNKSLIFLDFDTWKGGNTDYPIKVLSEINSNVSLNANDYLRVNFFIIRLKNFLPNGDIGYAKLSFENRFSNPIYSNVHAGTMTITDTINQTTVVTSDGYYIDNSVFSITGSNNNIIEFTDSASLLYGNVIFDQAAISSSTSLLYSPIDYPFTFEEGDVVRLSSFYTNNAVYYRVNQVIPPITGSGNTVIRDLQLVLDKPVQSAGIISSNFVIFRRLPDETSVILNFSKNLGEVSQATLIPIDLDLGVKSNLANIITQVGPDIASLNTN
jgi:hypothetical protein